jgi:hypothetical protein
MYEKLNFLQALSMEITNGPAHLVGVKTGGWILKRQVFPLSR